MGSGSATSSAHTDSAATSITLDGTTYTYAGTGSSVVGTVSVGSAGACRQIQYVAAGEISATSTDAVNGSQLYALEQEIGNLTTKVHDYSVNSTNPSHDINYNNGGATGSNAIAAGVGNTASGTESSAVGYINTASGTGS